MRGVITRRDVLIQSFTILRLFGPRAYLRCLRAALRSAPSTFLETLLASPGASRGAAERDGRHPEETLGNFPQAFSHLALISAAYCLDREMDAAGRPR